MAPSHQAVPPPRYVLVVGTDFSSIAAGALEEAVNMAERVDGAEIHLVHVVTSHIPPENVAAAVSHELTHLNEIDQADIELQRALQCVRNRRVRAGGHVRVGRPDREIARLAADLGADMVVVGSHGRHRYSPWILGSVTESLVRKAPCAVLVHRPRHLAREELIEPPCSACSTIRSKTQGVTLFCAWHAEHHTRAHTYYEVAASLDPGEHPPRA